MRQLAKDFQMPSWGVYRYTSMRYRAQVTRGEVLKEDATSHIHYERMDPALAKKKPD